MAWGWSRCGHVVVLLLCLAVSADPHPPAAAGDGGGNDGGETATVAELLRRGRQFAAGKEWQRALAEFEAARVPGRGGEAPAGKREWGLRNREDPRFLSQRGLPPQGTRRSEDGVRRTGARTGPRASS